MATHSSVLAWTIPRTEEPGGLQFTESQESDTTQRLNHNHHHYIRWLNNKVLLWSPGNCIQYPVMNHNGKEYEKAVKVLVVSNSLQLHELQSARLLCQWDFLGKHTGVGCHFLLQCMKVKSESEVAQSCLTLSDPMDCSPPGSPVPWILQARTLEWVAISFSNA